MNGNDHSPRYLVTGGAGFIGGNFVAKALREQLGAVLVLDKLTYAGHRATLNVWEQSPDYKFIKGDIGDRLLVRELLGEFRPTVIVNFAAESHVDRSIESAEDFIRTNVMGTYALLDEALNYWRGLGAQPARRFRFQHISTDEVYGSLGQTGHFTETTSYAPNSPYAATKAASDHLLRAYQHTYGLPTTLINCSNNYGPFQFPEKLIPLALMNALEAKPIPVYGDGLNVRDWLYVEDHCEAILKVLDSGHPGETYNIGGNSDITNLELLAALFQALRDNAPLIRKHSNFSTDVDYEGLIEFVPDRPGHDRRYAIDAGKALRELDWRPSESLESGLAKTVAWYITNQDWCREVTRGNYDRKRLGLERKATS